MADAPPFLNEVMVGAVLWETNEDAARLDDALFERWLRDIRSGSGEAVEVMMLEVEARLRRLALSFETTCDRSAKSAAEGSSRAGRSTRKVEQMAAFVAAHYTEPLLMREIGEAVGLPPDYANVLFRATFGVTRSDYLLEHRIAHAQRMRATTRETVANIA